MTIALYSATSSNTSSGSGTPTTIPSANSILLCSFAGYPGVSSLDYGGVSFTYHAGSGFYYILDPAVGTDNVNYTGGGGIECMTTSVYTDVFGIGASNLLSSSGTSVSTSVTTTSGNSWVVGWSSCTVVSVFSQINPVAVSGITYETSTTFGFFPFQGFGLAQGDVGVVASPAATTYQTDWDTAGSTTRIGALELLSTNQSGNFFSFLHN